MCCYRFLVRRWSCDWNQIFYILQDGDDKNFYEEMDVFERISASKTAAKHQVQPRTKHPIATTAVGMVTNTTTGSISPQSGWTRGFLNAFLSNVQCRIWTFWPKMNGTVSTSKSMEYLRICQLASYYTRWIRILVSLKDAEYVNHSSKCPLLLVYYRAGF